MHGSCHLFIVVPVTIVLVVTSAIASPTMHIHKKHHTPIHNRARATTSAYHDQSPPRRMRTKHALSPRSPDTLPLLHLSLGQLLSDRDGILSASNAFAQTTQEAHSHSAHNDAYHQEAATGLTDYRNGLGGLEGLLVELAADKGLANYDQSDQYETLLKDIFNASKNTFGDVDHIIDTDPTLGPILGPIMYDIKCILDDILDATENITDGLLNWLPPLLKPLIASSTETVCNSIIPPEAGLCLPV